MEMLIVAMILSSVTLRVAGNVAVDGFFAARGKESPRYARAKARSWRPSKPNGAASRYWSQLWEDSWNGALERHNRRRSGGRPDKPRGAARVFWSGVGLDARRAGRRYWDQGWTRLDEKRRSRSTRVPDGTDVVPGEVVPEPPVPGEPEPVLRDQPDGGTDLQFGTDPTDPTGTRSCPGCGGAVVVNGEICGACQYRQQQRSQYHDSQESTVSPEAVDDLCPNCGTLMDRIPIIPNPGSYSGLLIRRCPTCRHRVEEPRDVSDEEFNRLNPLSHLTPGAQAHHRWSLRMYDEHTANRTTTQEGTPTMTAMPTTEVVGLDQAISYCQASAVAHREQIVVIERTRAALDMGDVSGPAAGFLSQAMEANATCQTAMENAAAELAKQKAIQEQYDAVQGAGTREFITGGR